MPRPDEKSEKDTKTIIRQYDKERWEELFRKILEIQRSSNSESEGKKPAKPKKPR